MIKIIQGLKTGFNLKKKDIDENLNWSEDKTQILKTSIPKEETQGSTFEVEEIKEKMGYQNGKAKWRY